MSQPAEEPVPDVAQTDVTHTDVVEPESAGPEPTEPAPPVVLPLPEHVVQRSRMGAVWAGGIGFALVLLLLLIFILENGQTVDVSFFGAHGHLPLGVALLFSAVFGILLVVIPGVGRMAQLRWTARRHRQLDVDAAETAAPAAPPTRSQPES